MTSDIETFETITGWSSTGTITQAINSLPDFIALHKSASVLFTIPEGNLNKSVSKTLNVAMDGKNEIVLSVWSQRKYGNTYRQFSDFAYKIEFAPGVEFYMPVWDGFNQVSFFVPGLVTVSEIKITALFDDADFLLLSACVAVKDEYPLDILSGVKSEIERHVTRETGAGVHIGTVTALTGDVSIAAPVTDYIDRMSTIKIVGGGNTEVHAVDRTDESIYTLASIYDGEDILHDYTGADLYLNIPVEFGRYDQDAVFPGIFIWKMAASPVMRSSDVDDILDTASMTGWQTRRVPLNLVYHLLIDCEARHPEILAIMNRAMKRFLGSNVVWINGRLHTFQFQIEPVEIEPDQSVEQFPKVQYTVDIEVQEEREDRTGLVGVSTIKLNASPVGVLP